MRVGLFTHRHSVKHGLNLLDTYCILFFIFSSKKSCVIPIVLLVHFILDCHVLEKCILNFSKEFKYTKPDITSALDKGSDKIAPIVPDRIIQIAFLIFVLYILLITSGIETNPGPMNFDYDDNDDGSRSILSEMSSIHETFSTSVSFIHLNIQSLLPKLDLVYAEYNNFDILSFTETWLNSENSDDSIELINFQKPFRKDRGPEKLGGGVVVYVKDNVHARRRSDLEYLGVEAVWVQLKINSKNVLYGTFYVPPKSNVDLWNKVENSIESAVNDVNVDYVIVTGDFNDNQLDVNNVKMRNISVQYDLKQLIEDPTNFTEHSSSLIDLILTTDTQFVPYAGVGPPLIEQIRYHCPVIGFINAPKPPRKTFKRKIWLYNQGNFDEYRRILAQTNWDNILSTGDIDKITTDISSRILGAAETTIPNRLVTIRKQDPAWLTNDIRKLIRKKNRVHDKAKRLNKQTDWNKFRKIRNKVTSVVREARNTYQINLVSKLTSVDPSVSAWWKTCNQISGMKPSHSGIPPLLKNDNLIFDDLEKADELNNYFAMQTLLDESHAVLPDLNMPENQLCDIELNETDVEDVLSILNNNKASGPDLINPRLLKEASTELKYPLCRLFNFSLSIGVFPTEWKKANVTPVFKNNNPNDVKNYRPISLLSVISKCMERCVYKYVYNFLLQHRIITSSQSGFTHGDSAINQLVNISNDIGRALDSGKEIRVVFCDISKAFDRVWHKGLLFKLQQYGISGNLLLWFENYLSGRSQRVVLNGCNSGWRDIKSGVPQGSILGPLLFLLFINDIVTDINACIKLFADDTSIYLTVDQPQNTADILNRDLEKIHQWSSSWLVNFNPQKTQTMVISRKSVKPVHPPLKMNNHDLQEVSNHKHLGIFFSNNGLWHDHIDYIVKKAYQRLNMLRKVRFILDRIVLEKMYFSYVRPILEYGDVIWDNRTLALVNKLENVQTEAARIVTGGTKLTSVEKLYEETGWETLSKRREHHKLCLFYKIVNREAPEYLCNLLPDVVADRHNHNTRQSSNILDIRTRTNFYSDYFLPSAIKLWNNLPLHVRNSKSLSIFKNRIKNRIRKYHSLYYIGTRMGQILHARLRMNSSSLNEHLFNRNLVYSPNCQCGHVESTSHYLLFCNKYTNLRNEFIFTINYHIPIDVKLLLFGSENLSEDENKDIFLKVQKFILKSKRFTP